MKKTLEIIIASLFFSMISVSVYSANCSFLGNTAMSYFTKEDWKLSKAAQNEALDHYQDGVKVAWNNPHTGSHGIFLPSHTTHAKGSVCRELKIMHTANLMHEKSVYRFCKLHNEWKIV